MANFVCLTSTPQRGEDERFIKPTHRAAAAVGVVIGAAALVIAACGHKDTDKPMTANQYALSVEDPAGSACSRASSAAPPSTQGTISGGTVELHATEAGGSQWIPGFYLDLNYPTSASSFKSLVCVNEKPVTVGTYVDQATGKSSPANREDWTIRVLSWPNGDLIAEHQFQGADPPPNCTQNAGMSNCGGKPPQTEATAWIKTVITS
jgi:hypothetical protein